MTLNTETAGGIVLNNNNEVLIVAQKHNVWSLPKGHIEKNENTLEAAKREIKEESGVTQLKLIKELGHYSRYKISKSGEDDKSELKTIYLFLFTTTETDLKPEDPDNPDAKWIAIPDVPSYLTHAKDIAFYTQQLPIIHQFIFQKND